MSTFFISSIDTDAGKTIATGWLAAHIAASGQSVITMKLAQTGCAGKSDDVAMHRTMMGLNWLPVDELGFTCPYVFKFPASPHLAARLENQLIEPKRLADSLVRLQKKFQQVIVEGVGGLLVPLTEDYLVADFVLEHHLPVIIVTSAKLGSLNHTFLTLEVCHHRGIQVAGVLFNHYPVVSEVMREDSKQMIQNYLFRLFPEAFWSELPLLESFSNFPLNPSLVSKWVH
jgi:dethiobiotin synthetase